MYISSNNPEVFKSHYNIYIKTFSHFPNMKLSEENKQSHPWIKDQIYGPKSKWLLTSRTRDKV